METEGEWTEFTEKRGMIEGEVRGGGSKKKGDWRGRKGGKGAKEVGRFREEEEGSEREQI